MLLSINKDLRKFASFFLPFFIFSGYFKKESFSIATCYKDLTLWCFVIISAILLINGDFKKLVMRRYGPTFFIFIPVLFFILVTLLLHQPESLPFFSWKVQNFFVLLLPTVMLGFTCVKNDKDWHYLGTGIIILSLYTSFFIFFNSILSHWGHISYLMSGTITSLGGIVSFHRVTAKYQKQRMLNFIFFTICTLGVMISYGRGQQIVYGVILILSYITSILSTSSGIRVKLFLIFLPFILGFVCYLGYYYKMQRGEDIFIRYSSQYFSQALGERFLLFGRAAKLFESHPVIPSGIGRFSAESVKGFYKYPHNIPLEIMAEMGIWGGLWYIFILYCVAVGYVRWQKNIDIRPHLYIFLYLLLVSFKQGCVFTDKAFWVWAALGIGLLGRKVHAMRLAKPFPALLKYESQNQYKQCCKQSTSP